ncbi:MAG: TonB-dependent receptor [Acidobacteria bacterium]|nr:TonB-dependent receptor [Acidobacteriota bacterium]
MKAQRIVRLMVAALSLSLCVYAQVTTGTISGAVHDSSGGAIPSAQVVILNESTGISRTLQADAAGRYSAPSLNPGRYRVSASLQGFQTGLRSGIQLTVGREAIVDFELQVGQVTERIEVTGEAPLVQTTGSAVSYLVDDRTIRELPLNGRDITQLILLNPGVMLNSQGRGGSAENGFAQRLSVSGMRGEDNSYLLDGSYIAEYMRHVPAGPTGALTGVETVQEFQILTSTFSAQYGRAIGGVFNAITKSGTNQWHGGAYEFLRNSALDARNFFDRKSSPSAPRLPPFRRNHFGATFGGPVARDKAFFFVAYEGLRESLTTTGISNVPDSDARRGILPGRTTPVQIDPRIVPFLRMYPEPTPGARNFGNGSAQYFFTSKQPTREDFGQGRLDYQFSEQDSFFVRFTGNAAERATPVRWPDQWNTGSMGTRLVTLSETHVFSPGLLNSVRLYFNRAVPGAGDITPPAEPGQISVPGQPVRASVAPGSGISDIGGGLTDRGARYTTNRIGFNDDVNLHLRSHSLQFGGMLERLQWNPNFGFAPYGRWAFSNLANFLQALPDEWRGTPPQIGNFRRGVRQWFLALYLQDDWRVTPTLTLNLGVRWEPYTVATEVNGLIENLRYLNDTVPARGDPWWLNKSWLNFGPRAGFAWIPFPSGRTSLRGGIGLFWIPVDSAVYIQPLLRTPTISPVIEFAGVNPALFPDGLATIADKAAGGGAVSGAVNINALPFENLRSPHAMQYSLNLQQQIGANNVLTLGFSGRRGMNAPTYANFATPPAQFNGVSLELPANATPVNPAFGPNLRYISTNASSWYNGFTANFQRRFAAGFQGQLSYTFSRATSEGDGSENGPAASVGGSGTLKYPHDLRAGKSLTGYHLQNALSANYSYDLPFGRGDSGWINHLLSGWQLTGIVSLQDGQPFTVGSTSSTVWVEYISATSPNLKPGWTSDEIVRGSPDGYYTLDAFTAASPRELGNYGQRTLIGPGRAQWDFGISKNTQLSERWRLQFRAEAFNLLNRANFGSPGKAASGRAFTRAGAPVPSATVVTDTSTSSRQLQFGMKLIF